MPILRKARDVPHHGIDRASGPQVMHLCEEHAHVAFLQKESGSPAASIAGALAKQLESGANQSRAWLSWIRKSVRSAASASLSFAIPVGSDALMTTRISLLICSHC